MIINETDKIDTKAGKFILLADHGCEGLGVCAQSDDIKDIISHMAEGTYSRTAVVQLTDVSMEAQL